MVLVYHFLCEGAESKSEYIFISSIINEFNTSQSYELYCADGNRNIYSKFLEITTNFKEGDIFILFFDNVETIDDYLVVDLIEDIKKYCDKRRVIFRHTDYYCFEELFLTYSGALEVSSMDSKFKSEVFRISESILNRIDYFKVCDLSYWRDRYKHRAGVLATREKLSSYICVELTGSIRGNFKINKNSIGSCWISDCKDTTLHKNVCSQCRYPCKNSSFRDKLADLDNNSVSKLSLPFSTIFDTE